nr:hypothetical protein [Tanacetum cinerariifolium]
MRSLGYLLHELSVGDNPISGRSLSRHLALEVDWNAARYGHYCTPQVSFVYPEPGYNQDLNFSQEFQNFHDFQQQDLCCENCGQYTINHPVFNVQNDLFDSQNTLMEQLTSTCDIVSQFIQKKEEEKQIEEDQAANARYWKIHACYDDDDDDYAFAITPNEPVNSLSMWDEHLDIVPAMKSDEFIKSSVENLVSIPSESEGESECDVPAREEFATFSNILFDAENEFDSSDNQSFYDEDIDSLLDEFVGELTLLKSIPPGIDETDYDPEEEICFIERLFDSLMEEIDLSFTSDYPMPPSIEEYDYNSERDILILKDLPCNDTLSLPEIETFHFDIPSFFRPPAKPPDGNTGILNVKMMSDISEQKVPMPKFMITLTSNQEKSPDLLSHQGLKTF